MPIARYRDSEGDVWERYSDDSVKCVYFSDGQAGDGPIWDWESMRSIYDPALLMKYPQTEDPAYKAFAVFLADVLEKMAAKALTRLQESEDHIEREISSEINALFLITVDELRGRSGDGSD